MQWRFLICVHLLPRIPRLSDVGSCITQEAEEAEESTMQAKSGACHNVHREEVEEDEKTISVAGWKGCMEEAEEDEETIDEAGLKGCMLWGAERNPFGSMRYWRATEVAPTTAAPVAALQQPAGKESDAAGRVTGVLHDPSTQPAPQQPQQRAQEQVPGAEVCVPDSEANVSPSDMACSLSSSSSSNS
eukprot:scaffold164028_cov22-Tisochrysis_lutea.AAC.1